MKFRLNAKFLIVLIVLVLACSSGKKIQQNIYETSSLWRADTFGCLGNRKNISVDSLVVGKSSDHVRNLLGLPNDSSGSSVNGTGNWIYILSTDFCDHRENDSLSVWDYGGVVLELRMMDGVVVDAYQSIIN